MKLVRFHIAMGIILALASQEVKGQLIADFETKNLSGFPIDSGCIPDMIIQFTDLSAFNGVPLAYSSVQNGNSFNSHHWDFDYNNNISNVRNPVYGYFVPGTYNITLRVTQDGITFDSITKQIVVFVPPSVRISANPATGCDPLNVTFTNNSFSAGTTICETLIDFGDGSVKRKTGSAALDTFQHVYNLIPQQSCWTVTVIITDCRGCDSTRTYPNMICIDRPPVADFTPSTTLICGRPFNVSFDNTSQSVNSLAYRWDFGDTTSISAQFEPAHTYANAGSHIVTLTVIDTECLDTVSTTRTIVTRTIDANLVISTPVVCIGPPATATFDASTSVGQNLSYSWNFGDGQAGSGVSPQHSYAAAGTYTVTLNVSDDQGCSNIETGTVTVLSRPTVDFTANTTTDCKAPLDVTFTAIVSPPLNVSYTWSFGPTGANAFVANPTYTYQDPGSYPVILEVTDLSTGCTNSAIKTNFITILSRTVSFDSDVDRGCAPLTVNFEDLSGGVPPFTMWSWDFGDITHPGNTSALQNPQHTFVDTGTYVITFFAATAGLGCSGTVTDTIRVGNPLLPEFAIDSNPACVNEEVNFRNLTDTTGVGNTPVIWNWDFGGATSNQQDPPPQYYDDPTPPNDSIEVTLEVCYLGCCADTSLKLVILEPKAEFTAVGSCSTPGLVIISDSSKGADNWIWYFGDGDTLFMTPATYSDSIAHIYDTTGNYIIRSVVWNTMTNCTTEMTYPIDVSVLDADFDADKYTACVGEDVCFQNQSNGLANNNAWDFGDGSTSGLVAPCHAYTQPGTYSVKLIIKDANGCSDTINKPNLITVSGVTADFDSPNRYGCIPPSGNTNTITFNSISSSAPNSTITEWHWDFGEPPTQDYIGTAPALVTHTYLNPGVYTVTLTVKNSRGCEDSETKTAYVDVRKPIACFNLPYGQYCEDQPVVFPHCSQGSGLLFEWDFGDNTPRDIRASPDHIFTDEGCYDVTLYLRDGNGCRDTSIVDSAVCVSNPDLCILADDTSSVCPPHLACFDTCFNFFGIPIRDILWDFGDGSFSTILAPCHIYVRAGVFAVTLHVEFDNYCLDTLVKTSYINVGGAIGNITADPDTGCVPLPVILNSNDSGAVSRFWITPWDPFSVGRIGGDTIHSTVHVPGSWLPAVVLTDAQTPQPCSYVLYADFDLWADTVYADFWTASDSVCRADRVQFRDTSRSLLDTNIVKWQWDFGDGTTDTVQHPAHVFQSIGLDTVCLTASSSIECYATICKTIFVRDKPDAIFTISDSSGCDTLLVNFLDFSTPGVDAPLDKWYWDYGDTATNADTSIIRDPSFYTYRDTGQYLPYLVVTDADGCDDTATIAINIYKTPDGIYNRDTLPLCWGDTVQLLTDSVYDSYQWTPDTALSNDTIANPLAFPRDTTSYEVYISEPHGCDKRDTVTINVIPLPPLSVSPHPDTTICFGDTVQLNAVGGSNPDWFPPLWISDRSSYTPLSYPDSTITYTVTVEGIGGCTSKDTVRIIVSGLVADFVGERSCFGGSTDFVDLSAGTDLPIISWQWDFGDLNGTSSLRNPAYTYSTADSFLAQLVISDAIGCTDTATQIVFIDTPATAIAGIDTTICFGDSVQLFSSGGSIVFWTPLPIDSPNVFNPWATPSSTTTYTAHITNGVCPYDEADVVVTVIPPPEIRTIEDATLLRGETIQLVTTVDRYDSIFWTPADSLSCTNCLSPFASPDETITYRIDVKDQYECTNSESVTIDVTIECGEDQIWVASAFMPNSAEFPENRDVKVHLIGLEKMNYFRIYDRWGKLMFETDDINEGWDGRNIDGVKVSGDVYVFVCEAVCWYKKAIVKTGNITLIR